MADYDITQLRPGGSSSGGGSGSDATVYAQTIQQAINPAAVAWAWDAADRADAFDALLYALNGFSVSAPTRASLIAAPSDLIEAILAVPGLVYDAALMSLAVADATAFGAIIADTTTFNAFLNSPAAKTALWNSDAGIAALMASPGGLATAKAHSSYSIRSRGASSAAEFSMDSAATGGQTFAGQKFILLGTSGMYNSSGLTLTFRTKRAGSARSAVWTVNGADNLLAGIPVGLPLDGVVYITPNQNVTSNPYAVGLLRVDV